MDLRVVVDEGQLLTLFRGITIVRHCCSILLDRLQNRQRGRVQIIKVALNPTFRVHALRDDNASSARDRAVRRSS
jgi:hypothetical protein